MASERHELDTLIDDVAREMTAGEPGASFASDVVARIDGRRRAWRSSWFLSSIAAAAVVLIALFVWRSPRPADRGPEGSAQQAPDFVARPLEGRDQQPDRGPERPALHAIAQAGPKGPALQTANLPIANPIPSDIDALSVPAIAVDAIAEAPLPSPDAIQTDPLTIAPLNVTPLELIDSVEGGGDETQRRFE
jgi:hypothetical protein